MGSHAETWLSAFPAGFKQGDTYKVIEELYNKHTIDGKTDYHGIERDTLGDLSVFCEVERERVAKGLGKDANDGLGFKDVIYHEITKDERDNRDAFFEALLRGDDAYVKKALTPQSGESGIHVNLNITPDHSGFPAHGSLPGTPAIIDRRKYKLKDAGLKVFARCFPRSGLRSVVLQLGRNDFGTQAFLELLKAIPDDIEDFKLILPANNIRNAGCIGLAQKLTKLSKLQSLHLALGANNIGDQGHDMLVNCIPRSVREFSVAFRWNPLSKEGGPARQKMWDMGDEMTEIKDKHNPREFFLMY